MNQLQHHPSSTYSRFANVFKLLVLAAMVFLAHPTIKAQNNCLSFDGSNDHINLGTLSPSGNFTTGFTYIGWVKWGAFNNWSRLFDFGTGQGVNNILLACNATSNSLTLSNYLNTTPYQFTTGNIVPLNQWVHIAATISSSGAAKVYVNGELVGTGNIQPPANISRNICYLGKSNWTADAYFNGSMDEVSIWTRELTSTEINNSMFNSLVGNESGLYIYYKFNQGIAGGPNTAIATLNDETANAKHGTLTGFALNGASSNFIQSQTPSTIQNNCLSFDGVNDYVALPALGSNLSQFTLETWFNASSFATSGNLNCIYNTNTWSTGDVHFQFINNSGTLQTQLAVCGSTIQNITYNFATNTWYHLATTYNATTKIIKLYVNGSLVQSVPIATAVNANFTASQIGAWTTQRYFAGKFEEYRIWSTERTASEISANMLTSLVGSETGLLANYKFNQGVAGGTNTNLTGVTNATGINHGALGNFALTGSSSNWVSSFKNTPSTHVTNFTGSLVNNKMTLTWTDAIGETTPDGYYIFASKTNSFTAPIDGSMPTIDNDLSDGAGVIRINQGVQTYNGWTNEEINTNYYFNIYPFTNPGITIKFNTTGQIPQAQIVSRQLFVETASPLPSHSGSYWADYNNDGYLDLLAQLDATEKTTLFRNNQNNTYTAVANFNAPSSEYNLNWLDFDRNGYLDITGRTNIYLNNTVGGFNTYPASNWGLESPRGEWADFDNDGDLDLLQLANNGYDVKLFQNTNGIYKEVFGNNFRPCNGALMWFDYNNDGFKDILTTGKNPIDNKYYTTIYKNTGNVKFVEQMQFNLPGKIFSLFLTDYNADGWMDILCVAENLDNTTSLTLIKNGEGNGFSPVNNTTLNGQSSRIISTADLNNDGLSDFLVVTIKDYVTINEINYAICEFKVISYNYNNSVTEIYNNVIQIQYVDPSITDINNDGNIDFLINGRTQYFQNIVSVVNQRPNKITNATAVIEGNGVRFQWSATDDKTPSAGLTYNLRIGTSPGVSNILSAHSNTSGILKMLKPGNMGTCTSVFYQLPKGTYYWNIQAIDNSFKGGAFMDADKSFTIPDIQASNLNAKIIDGNSLKLKWTNGNGTKRAVFCKIGTSGLASPSNNKTYLPSPLYGNGDQIGTSGWYCVYNGISDSVIVNNLSISNSYIFQVFEYSGNSGSEVYMTAVGSGNPGVFGTALFSEQPNIPNTECSYFTTTSEFIDYNNDGFLDIAVYAQNPYIYDVMSDPQKAYNALRIFRNNKDNTFEEQSMALPQYTGGAVSWADFDNNGFPDIAVCGYYFGQYSGAYNTTKLYKNDNGIFSYFQNLTSFHDGYFAWGDFNNDGNIDLAAGGQPGSVAPVSILYLNSGAPDYTMVEQPNVPLLGVSDGAAKWGDYNNDGWIDLVIAGNTNDGNYKVVLYENNKGIDFINSTVLLQFERTFLNSNIDWVDYDKDGNNDIIWTSDINNTIFHNNGDNTFTQIDNAFPAGNSNCSFAIGDFNNDNAADVVFARGGQKFKSLYQNNNNLFTLRTDFIQPYSDDGSVAWGDYDNDGDLDIITASHYKASNYSFNVNILKNNLNMKAGIFPASVTPSAPQNISTTIKPGQLVVTWDRISKDISFNYSYNVMLTCIEPDKILLNSPNSDTLTGRRLVSSIGNAGYNNFAIFKNLTPGKYQIKVQSINGAYEGGSWSTPITVTVKDLQAFYSFTEVCRGSETQFTDQSIPQTNLTWLWKFDDGTSSTEQNPKHKFVASGTHQVWLVVTSTDLKDANGNFLKDSVLHTINVKPNPIASFTAPNVCQGTETNFTNTTDPDGTSVKSWEWDYGNAESSVGIDPINKTYGIAKTYKTKLVVIATNDCADSAIVNTTVSPIPSAFIYTSKNSKFDFCKNSSDSALLYVTKQANCTYQWLDNGAGVVDKTDTSLTIAGCDLAKTYSLQAIVKLSDLLGGCSSKTPTAVLVTVKESPDAPTIVQPPVTTICEGDTLKLSIAPIPNVTYAWSGGLNPNSSNNHNATTSGNYSVRVSNSTGCAVESTNKIDVTVNPKPDKPVLINSLGATTTICSDKELLLKVDDTPGMTYKWFNGVALLPNATTAQFRVEQSGSYSVSVKNGFDCSNTAAPIQITVNQSPTAPSIAYSGSTTFCGGDSLLLTAPPINGMTYSWLLNGGDLGVTSNDLFAKASGSYSVKVKNTLQCEAISAPISVIVNPSPAVPSVSYGDTEFCQGGSITFSVASINGLFYQWMRGKESILGATSSTYTTQEKGDYWLSITNSSQCGASTSPVTVTVNDLPAKPAIGEVNGITSFCPETEVTLKVQNASSSLNYQWRRSGINIEGAGNYSYAGKLSAGDYSVVASKGICSAESDIITLNTKQAPVKPTISARGPNVWILVCDNKAANIYKWYYNNQLIPTANTYQYVANKNLGDYKVEVNEGGECSTVSDIINIPTGNVVSVIDELIGEIVSISPNPSSGIFNVDLGAELIGSIDVQILDSKGALMLSQQLGNTSNFSINLGDYPNGIYLCKISHKGSSFVKKIVKLQ